MASSGSEGEDYEVDKILKQRKRQGLVQYLVRWKGFGADEDDWVPGKNISKQIIRDFDTTQSKAKSNRRSSSRSRSRSRGRPSSRSRKVEVKKKEPASPARSRTRETKRKTDVQKSEGLVEKVQTVTTTIEDHGPTESKTTTFTSRRIEVKTASDVRQISDSKSLKDRLCASCSCLHLRAMDTPIIILIGAMIFVFVSFYVEDHYA